MYKYLHIEAMLHMLRYLVIIPLAKSTHTHRTEYLSVVDHVYELSFFFEFVFWFFFCCFRLFFFFWYLFQAEKETALIIIIFPFNWVSPMTQWWLFLIYARSIRSNFYHKDNNNHNIVNTNRSFGVFLAPESMSATIKT